jgi:hypothetical protein
MEAMYILCRGLRIPSLVDNEMLAGYLIDLQTSGNRLPTTESAMNEWLHDILEGNLQSKERRRGVAGAWEKKITQHLIDVRRK